ITPPPLSAPLFPYTTLFRSDSVAAPSGSDAPPRPPGATEHLSAGRKRRRRRDNVRGWLYVAPFLIAFGLFLIWPTIYGLWMSFRSEEHTSELQSRFDLVCRL